MLLGSPPDMVHSRQSRGTHSSTRPDAAQATQTSPSFRDTILAIADFEYRDPLLPRLVWPWFTSYSALLPAYYITMSFQFQEITGFIQYLFTTLLEKSGTSWYTWHTLQIYNSFGPTLSKAGGWSRAPPVSAPDIRQKGCRIIPWQPLFLTRVR